MPGLGKRYECHMGRKDSYVEAVFLIKINGVILRPSDQLHSEFWDHTECLLLGYAFVRWEQISWSMFFGDGIEVSVIGKWESEPLCLGAAPTLMPAYVDVTVTRSSP